MAIHARVGRVRFVSITGHKYINPFINLNFFKIISIIINSSIFNTGQIRVIWINTNITSLLSGLYGSARIHDYTQPKPIKIVSCSQVISVRKIGLSILISYLLTKITMGPTNLFWWVHIGMCSPPLRD